MWFSNFSNLRYRTISRHFALTSAYSFQTYSNMYINSVISLSIVREKWYLLYVKIFRLWTENTNETYPKGYLKISFSREDIFLRYKSEFDTESLVVCQRMPIRNESEWKDRHASRCIALLGWLETCIAAFLFLHILCKSNKHVYTKFTFLHKWSSEWMEFRFNNSKTFSIIGWIHFLLRIGNLETKSAYIFFFQHWRKHRESWYLSLNLFKIGKKEVVKISSNIIIRIIFFSPFTIRRY